MVIYAGHADPALDVAEVYRALSGRLEHLVRMDVHASDVVIEDACQFAWSRFVHHSDRVRREAALSWLVRTAVHEAFKLIRRADRCLSLDAAIEQAGESGLLARVPTPDQQLADREKLATIRALPERQQRLLWLHGLGLSYAEMAHYMGCTTRTVERQLLRAKHRLREASLE
jgi:RNA polymerase sigma factor (sigma-70 family)